MSRIVITGATGLIGSALAGQLRARGDSVVVLSRNPERAAEQLGPGIETAGWPDPTAAPPPGQGLAGADGIIHLLGESIAQRWSDQVKQRIHDSRVLGTRNLVAALLELPEAQRPRVLVSQSATGYYGARGSEELAEAASPGEDFLAGVVKAWEAEALAAEDLGMRVVLTRTGVVLAPRGGALEKMLPPFRMGVGGPIAGGRQYIPWVHIEDVVGALLFCLDHDTAAGPVNVTAPEPVTNADFSKVLGHVLKRPTVLPVPASALKLLYGEMAQIVLTGQRVVPRHLGQLGFSFGHPDLEPALQDVLSR